ncbi:MAG: hypothetical protein H3C28_14915, partial [Sphingomonadales bacterium]|nr:hypothetical protein [Sphingomonadales bacterium]
MTNPARIAVGISAIGFVAAIGIYTLIRGDFDPAPSAPAKNAVSWSIAPPIGDGSAEEESASPDSLAKASSSQYRPMDFGAKYHGFVVGQRASLADALTGALEGTPEGLEALQRYFDAALGDEEALRHLAGRLLDALGESAIRNDYDAMSKATERVGEAVAQAMAAGYTASYQFLDNYKLPRTAHGWDFGDDAKKAPGDFIRIGVKSREVKGNHLRVFDLPGGAPLFGDGLEDVERFATDLPDGLYRIYILSAKRANGALPRHPFGDSVRTNGRSVRLIETRQSFPEAQVRFTAGGIDLDLPAAATAAEEIAPTTIRYNAAKSAQGLLVMTQALVANGAFTVEFDVPEGSETYLVGLIAEESDYSAIEKDLELQIAALLAGTETAAGQPAAAPKISPFKVAFVVPAASSNPGRGGPSASSSGGSGSGGYSPGGGGSSTSSGGSSGSGSSGGISPASSGGNASSGSGPGGATSTSGGSSTSTSGGDGSSGSSTSSGGSSTSGGDGSSGSTTSSGGSSTSGGDGSSGSSTSSGGSSTSGSDGSSGSSTSSGGSSTSGGDGSSGSSTSSGGSSTSGGDGSSGSSTSSGGSSTSGGDGSSGSSTSSGGSSTSGGDGSSGSS